MPATFGVENLFGLTVPAGGHVQESSSESSIEVATIRNASGVTVKAVPKPLVTKTVTLKGDHIAEEFQQLVEAYVARKYPRRENAPASQN